MGFRGPGRVILAALILCLLPSVAAGKKKHYHSGTTKTHWKRESECVKTVCKGFHSDENDDCVSRCVSEACYNEVYAAEPLEPGEVDKPRQIRFNSCVRKENGEGPQERPLPTNQP